MNEQLISFETAIIAENKGFKVPVNPFGFITKYYHKRTGSIISHGMRGRSKENMLVYAPPQSQLQKWLRDKHGIHIEIFLSNSTPYTYYYYKIMRVGKYFTLCYDDIPDNENYELVLELALLKALEAPL